jgi:hypothetical protein
MSNKYKPHLLILPEDDANIDLANGFQSHPGINLRAIQIEHPVGGWLKVLECFKEEHVYHMGVTPYRHMLLLLDFDNDSCRLDYSLFEKYIPENLRDRVFVLGANPEPEKLKSCVSNGYETIGQQLAKDCLDQTNTTWGHDLLKHNQTELVRMRAKVNQFLFKH